MFRTSDIVLVAAMVAAAAFTYTTKHQVEAQLAEVRKIEGRIRYEEDTLSILKADWRQAVGEVVAGHELDHGHRQFDLLVDDGREGGGGFPE